MGMLETSDPPQSWVSPPHPIHKNIKPAGWTSHCQASEAGWGHLIPNNHGSAKHIQYTKILGQLVEHQIAKHHEQAGDI
jgi:hypothetical protein